MSAIGSATPASVVRDAAPPGSAVPFPSRWLGFAVTYVRVTLAAAFLSAVASRFGLWTGEPWSGAFQRFVGYTAEVNSFLPTAAASFLAWSATAAERCSAWLLLGVQRRAVAFASAVLLASSGRHGDLLRTRRLWTTLCSLRRRRAVGSAGGWRTCMGGPAPPGPPAGAQMGVRDLAALFTLAALWGGSYLFIGSRRRRSVRSDSGGADGGRGDRALARARRFRSPARSRRRRKAPGARRSERCGAVRVDRLRGL